MKAAFHPRTEVAFAPTSSFVKKWPDEAKAQQSQFERPSWAAETKCEAVHEKIEEMGKKAVDLPGKCPLSAREIGIVAFFAGFVVGLFVAKWQ